ncbi:hypothetical protein TEA_008899 [Camellia sinensis var. sinensis]|uniref:Uncharacterized protein n=1 Tax=Camellia sinensis var. sinensis TaxID=542762 RepID=A0A4S4D9C9_CAMSN|nr:hypothetical protein TEA_008899 [Camellia sinensis var. sinensis]
MVTSARSSQPHLCLCFCPPSPLPPIVAGPTSASALDPIVAARSKDLVPVHIHTSQAHRLGWKPAMLMSYTYASTLDHGSVYTCMDAGHSDLHRFDFSDFDFDFEAPPPPPSAPVRYRFLSLSLSLSLKLFLPVSLDLVIEIEIDVAYKPEEFYVQTRKCEPQTLVQML